ncbi:MAG: guanylate kinase [Candidatus Omnitrophica bacterium]|nr:guanylate kinase [Candidatus Omnitrophota bacterium]
MKNLIFVLSAPSGTGKTTILKILKDELKDVDIVVTYTTRKPRPGEKDGIDYNFIEIDEFKKKIEKGELIEWSIVYGNYYGIPKDKIEENLKKEKKTLLIIDTQGGLKIKKIYPNAFLIGILPPSLKEQERRLRERKDMPEEEIKKRLSFSKQERDVIRKHYDIKLINRDLRKTIEKIKKIILS